MIGDTDAQVHTSTSTAGAITLADYLTALYGRCDPAKGGDIVFVTKKKTVAAHLPVGNIQSAPLLVKSKLADLFLKINLMDHKKTLARNPKGIGGIAEVKAIVSFHLDVDAAKDDRYLTRDKMLAALAAMPLPPSAIINTNGDNGGFHAYWFLAEPHYITDDDDRKRCADIATRWLTELRHHAHPGKIDGTANLDRVLRPVGSIRKSGNVVLPHTWEPERRYALDDFVLPAREETKVSQSSSRNNESAWPAMSVRIKRARKYLDTIPGAVTDQGGSLATLEAACHIHRFAVSGADAMTLLQEYNQRCQPAWSDKELAHKLADAEKKVREAGKYGIKLNDTDSAPEVIVSLAYGSVCDQVTKHLGQLGWESRWIPADKRERLKIYQRCGALVQVIESDEIEQLAGIEIPKGSVKIKVLHLGQMPIRIADACRLVQEKMIDEEPVNVPVPPTKWLVDGVFTRGDWGRDIRRLEGVITAPTIRSDGSILQQAGFDEKTGLLFKPDTIFPTVTEKPTRDDAKRAAAALLEVVKDFPFVDDADRSAWLSLVLSQIGRAAIRGCVPMFAVTATTRGSGKSLLADAASIIAYGRSAPRKTFAKDDEMRKCITAAAIEALPAILLDNVDCVLGGSSLDAAITSLTWTDRILGASKTTGELPLRTVWTATGNNLCFGSDLARRVLPIRIAPQIANPEERDDFEHDNLLEWVSQNRAALAAAALTLLRAYIVAGRPVQVGGAWGSFEAWSELVRGAIVWTGLSDPLKTRETAKADDQSVAIVLGLVGGLIEVTESSDGITAREIASRLNNPDPEYAARYSVMREVCAEIATVKGAVDARKLGLALRKYRGRIAEGYEITGKVAGAGVVRWNTKPVHGGNGGNGGNVFSPFSREFQKPTTGKTSYAYGNGLNLLPPSPPSPPSTALPPAQCKCGAVMVPAEFEVDGWRNWDCLACGAVKPVQEESAKHG